jgi:hypothetical protein
MNATLDQSPCPALNTLANHGFLPRDGRAVEVEELYQVLEDVYGMVRPVFFILGAQFRGVPFATAADGSQSFDLVDLFALDHDASNVTANTFFESMADPDDSLLDDLLAAAGDDGLLTWEEAAAARAVRILDSRRRNPQAVLTFEGLGSTLDALAEESVALFFLGDDPDLKTVATVNLESILGRNHTFPPGFVPRVQQGLPLLARASATYQEALSFLRARHLEALTVNLTTNAPTSAPSLVAASNVPTTMGPTASGGVSARRPSQGSFL